MGGNDIIMKLQFFLNFYLLISKRITDTYFSNITVSEEVLLLSVQFFSNKKYKPPTSVAVVHVVKEPGKYARNIIMLQ